jgi:hypothetical protein
MAAPNLIEIANMRTWNIYRHYYRYRQMYVDQGRAIAAGIRTMLNHAQLMTQAQPPNLIVAEDDIANAFRSFLLNDVNWMAYLRSKAHMIGPVHLVMTDIMARFIAWEAYVDITK